MGTMTTCPFARDRKDKSHDFYGTKSKDTHSNRLMVEVRCRRCDFSYREQAQ